MGEDRQESVLKEQRIEIERAKRRGRRGDGGLAEEVSLARS